MPRSAVPAHPPDGLVDAEVNRWQHGEQGKLAGACLCQRLTEHCDTLKLSTSADTPLFLLFRLAEHERGLHAVAGPVELDQAALVDDSV